MSDVVIIGSGISGMLVARELCAENVSVTIVERTAQAGQESSWAGGGIISPLYPWRYDDSVSRLAQWSQQRYQLLCDALLQETGIDPEWTQSGLLIMTDELEQAKQWAKAFGQSLDIVDRKSIREIEPAFKDVSDQGVWLPEIAQVRNPRLVKALKASLDKQGVRFITDNEAQGFIVANSKIQGLKTSQGDIFTDKVVVASGAWSRQLLATVDLNPPAVEPVMGQMLLFKASPGLLKRIVLSEQRYIIPRRDGRVLVGSTLEHVGFNKEITETARDDLYATALKLVPALRDWPIEHQWAGLRPGSPQSIPYIYEHPEISDLYVNCGHYRNGVALGPASAHLLVDQMLNRTPILPVEAYALHTRESGAVID